MRDTLRLAAVYVGTVIGAGFATGREIESYFTAYGVPSIFGIIIAGLLFIFLGVRIMTRAALWRTDDYIDYFGRIMGKIPARIADIFILLFMFSCFCVMAAGSGAFFHEILSFPLPAGIIIMLALCYLVFIFGAEGIIKLNVFLAPIIAVGLLCLSCYALLFGDVSVLAASTSPHKNWLVSSLLYVSYNAITIPPVLAPLGRNIKNPHSARWAGLLGGGVLLIVAAALWLTLMFIPHAPSEIPLLPIAGALGQAPGIIYGITLFSAIYTTAAANGFGLLSRMGTGHNVFKSFVLCGLAFPLSLLGFSNLVDKLYALFGILGLILLIALLRPLPKMRK